ncbi:hypothetical protein PIB30_067722 [Stylosanthes scabra]|uniref:Uncharacterized protein n=1 Tax=Stylosanthes scabra TaxID=79078 RepID=A0ABU6TME2_9FABA|nr:hypothetical protein [Stylosanthes scabra]
MQVDTIGFEVDTIGFEVDDFVRALRNRLAEMFELITTSTKRELDLRPTLTSMAMQSQGARLGKMAGRVTP